MVPSPLKSVEKFAPEDFERYDVKTRQWFRIPPPKDTTVRSMHRQLRDPCDLADSELFRIATVKANN